MWKVGGLKLRPQNWWKSAFFYKTKIFNMKIFRGENPRNRYALTIQNVCIKGVGDTFSSALFLPKVGRGRQNIWDCIRAPSKRGRYWEIHLRSPRDFPTPERHLEGLKKSCIYFVKYPFTEAGQMKNWIVWQGMSILLYISSTDSCWK